MKPFATVTARIDWHLTATPFAFLDHEGESFALRQVDAGIDIYWDIDGDDVRIAQVDTEAEALAYIAHYVYQLID